MRSTILTCGLLLSLASGCVSKFDGEWLEDAGQRDIGNTLTASGERRMAIKFSPPSLVRTGLYLERNGVVDEESVQENGYFLFDGFKVAQFGAMTAKVNGRQLTASVPGGPERHFTRVRGKSIFPPAAIPPAFGG